MKPEGFQKKSLHSDFARQVHLIGREHGLRSHPGDDLDLRAADTETNVRGRVLELSLKLCPEQGAVITDQDIASAILKWAAVELREVE